MPTAPVTAPSAAPLAQLDAQIAVASRTLGPNHPDLIALQRQRGALAAAVNNELAAGRSVVRGGGGSVGPSIESLYSAQKAKVLAQRGQVDEAQRLAADVRLLRDQYDKMSTRMAEVQQEAQSTETGLTLLGSAVAPSNPSFPNIPLIIFGAIGLGLALGILAALLVELLSRKVRGADDLKIGTIPVIGVMTREPRKLRARNVPLLLGFSSGRA
jgi:polysaccharide biosynthesis transport protein